MEIRGSSLIKRMAFNKTDSFEVAQLSPTTAWIGGVQLDSEASGTIGFVGSEADIVLPEGFLPSGDGVLVRIVRVVPVMSSALGLTNLCPSVAKAGDDVEDFLITVTNTRVGLATQVFEIYIDLIEGSSKSCVTVNVNCAC